MHNKRTSIRICSLKDRPLTDAQLEAALNNTHETPALSSSENILKHGPLNGVSKKKPHLSLEDQKKGGRQKNNSLKKIRKSVMDG